MTVSDYERQLVHHVIYVAESFHLDTNNDYAALAMRCGTKMNGDQSFQGNWEDMQDAKQLIDDHLRWRFNETDSFPNNDLELARRMELARVMRRLCVEFHRRYERRFAAMATQIDLDSSGEIDGMFGSIADELFNDGVRWGRIVALFSFSDCMLQILTASIGNENAIVVISGLLNNYTRKYLIDWIEERGGWDGFVKYFLRERRRDSWAWKQVSNIAGLVIASKNLIYQILQDSCSVAKDVLGVGSLYVQQG